MNGEKHVRFKNGKVKDILTRIPLIKDERNARHVMMECTF